MFSLAWCAGRAAAMSPREVGWRTRRVSQSPARRGGSRKRTDSRMLATSVPDWNALLQRFRDGSGRPVLLDQDRASQIAAECPAEVYARPADRRCQCAVFDHGEVLIVARAQVPGRDRTCRIGQARCRFGAVAECRAAAWHPELPRRWMVANAPSG